VNSLYAVYDKAHEGFRRALLEMLPPAAPSIIPSCQAVRARCARSRLLAARAGLLERMIGELEGCDHVQCIKSLSNFTFYIRITRYRVCE